MAATTGLAADSTPWISGINGGPVKGELNSLMSAPYMHNREVLRHYRVKKKELLQKKVNINIENCATCYCD